jgi:hypothetical protein
MTRDLKPENINQCMGCQAGWPIKPSGYGRSMLHDVIDGHAHEVVGCTAYRYRNASDHDAGDEDRKP